MNYELAKELKDAGFPQTPSEKNADPTNIRAPGFYLDSVYVPSLAELIEAVKGEKMNTFELTSNQEWATYEPANEDGPWAARYYDLTPVGFYEAGAKTPEEALARLWLALHGKD